MNMITKSKSMRHSRGFLLSVVCAGAIAGSLGGCAEGPYATAYDSNYYYPTAYYASSDYGYGYGYGYPYSYYGYPYSSYYYGSAPTYYGRTYDRTYSRAYGRTYVRRSGVRSTRDRTITRGARFRYHRARTNQD